MSARTVRQRKALLALPPIRGTRAMITLDAFRHGKLAYVHGTTLFWSITALGLRLRAILESERKPFPDGKPH